MKRTLWRKQHKWLGLVFGLFMLMFCVSGILLNHRHWVADLSVSRGWLPDDYQFCRWNGGLLRGTIRGAGDGQVLLYGNSGIWQTDSCGGKFTDLNKGLPEGADYRNVRACVKMPDNSVWAACLFGLYRMDEKKNEWVAVDCGLPEGERLSDLTCCGDTIVAVGRSFLYRAVLPSMRFERIEVKAPEGYDGRVSLFRTVWALHSGELFGLAGKFLMDAVAIVLIVLCVTGLVVWLMPKLIRRRKKSGRPVKALADTMKRHLGWHDKLGRYLFVVLILVSFTGWCLRPPVLIALVSARVPAVPFTFMDSENAWHDRLRMLRYDDACGDWLLSSSEGLYTMASLEAVPVRVAQAPPISVMGLNAWQKVSDGRWLMGSFSGLFLWDRAVDRSVDYFTGEVVEEVAGPPFGKFAVAGYSDDIKATGSPDTPIVVEYYKGTDSLDMPPHFTCLPMSLWNLALEVHTGRIYTILGKGTLIYIFFAGLLAMWCVFSGYKIRKR